MACENTRVLVLYLGLISLLSNQRDFFIEATSNGLKGKSSYVAVPGQSVTLTWSYQATSAPVSVTFTVTSDLTQGTVNKLWTITFPGSDYKSEQFSIPKNNEYYIFNKATQVKIDGKYSAHLIINSVPKNITKFRFGCKISVSLFDIREGFATVGLAEAPTVKINIRKENNEHAVEGGKVHLSCVSTGLPIPQVHLQRLVGKNVTSLSTGSGNITYTIAKLKLSDAGMYTCSAKNMVGEVKESSSITVKQAPTVKIIVKKNEDHVVKGGQVHLSCVAAGLPVPRVRLQKLTGKELTSLGVGDGKIEFSISNVEPSDAGVYSCSAKNTVGEVVQNASITVKYIEIDGSFKSNLNAQIQAQLSLTCPINGVPTPTYSWSKDGKTISDKKTLSLSLKDKNQFGLYECKGVNVVGTRKVEYRITEIYIKKIIPVKKILAKINEKTTLTCHIEGNPKPKIAWYKNKKLLFTKEKPEVHLNSKAKFGNYTCRAENDAGKETVIFAVEELIVDEKEEEKTPQKKTADERTVRSSSTRSVLSFLTFGLCSLIAFSLN